MICFIDPATEDEGKTMRQSARHTGFSCELLVNTLYRVIIFIGRKNAGVNHNKHNYSGKEYIDNKVRLIKPCLYTCQIRLFPDRDTVICLFPDLQGFFPCPTCLYQCLSRLFSSPSSTFIETLASSRSLTTFS